MTAPAIVTAPRTATQATTALGDVSFLTDAVHPVYSANLAAWEREERRFAGGDEILSELWSFVGESSTRLNQRKNAARWISFGRVHASLLAGHLAAVQPMPDFGKLGLVRTRENIDTPTLAELFYYNCTGRGSTGLQWPAFLTGVQMRAIATGHRWLLVEVPALPLGRNPDAPITRADVLAGHRPYLREISPRLVPYWEETDGRLDWAIIRTNTSRSGFTDGVWKAANTNLGFYLLVRQGYEGLGPAFAEGGWWLFDAEKRPVIDRPQHGTWDRTRGQIPLSKLIADDSEGTDTVPTLGRSLTFPLDQISVGLMNTLSAREADAWDASKNLKILAGLEKDEFNIAVQALTDGQFAIPMPYSRDANGTPIPVNVIDTGGTTVPSTVFSTIIDSAFAEAHDLMLRQLTSTPDSSGASKRAGFAEATSPLLSAFAARRETVENWIIETVELRSGFPNPSGFVVWPKEFELTPIQAKVDETFARMKAIGASSPTLVAEMIVKAAQEDGLIGDKETKAVTDELTASMQLANAKAQADTIAVLINASVSLGAAAEFSGVGPDDAKLLVEGSALDQVALPPEPNAPQGTTIATRFPIPVQGAPTAVPPVPNPIPMAPNGTNMPPNMPPGTNAP